MDSVERIARACGKARRTRQGWLCCCVGHTDREPSLEIVRGHTAILLRCYAGCDSGDLADILRARGFNLGKRGRGKRDAAATVPQPAPLTADDKTVALARAVWAESTSARGTPVEYYLAGRGLVLPPSINLDVIRWHPDCPRGRDRMSAMVTALRDPQSDKLVGIHRTFLSPDYKLINKMMLGHAGVAKLASHDAVMIAGRLTGCEGIETGLALTMQGKGLVWAFGSAGNLGRCPLLPGVNGLLLCLDNDRSRTGWRVGQQAYWRWVEAGRACEMVMLDSVGGDFADLEAVDAG